MILRRGLFGSGKIKKLRIERVDIEGLFGRFDYSIDGFHNENIKIITAPNGYGKSTIINIIKNFSSGNHYYFIRENYKIIRFYFSSSEVLEIRKLSEKNQPVQVFISSGKNSCRIKDPFEEDRIAIFERLFSFLTRVGPGSWRNDHTGEILSKAEILERYGDHPVIRKSQKIEPWVLEIIKSLDVSFISTNRLKTEPEYRSGIDGSSGLMVSQVASSIKEKISVAIRDQFEKGRELETSFPNRLIQSINQELYPSIEEVRDLINEIQRYENKYVSLGLLPAMSTTAQLDFMYHENGPGLTVLKTYLDDIKVKFSVLEDVSLKLEVFTKSMNSLLDFKRIEPSRDEGITVRVLDGNLDVVPLHSLSSGEQHLLVLLGRLVFQEGENSLVLIDEPEISFHPDWQERFLGILDEISSINGFSALVATHSPILIAGRWGQVVELAEQVGGAHGKN